MVPALMDADSSKVGFRKVFYCSSSQTNIFSLHRLCDQHLFYVCLNGTAVLIRKNCLQEIPNDLSSQFEKSELKLAFLPQEAHTRFEVCCSCVAVVDSKFYFACSYTYTLGTHESEIGSSKHGIAFLSAACDEGNALSFFEKLNSPSNFDVFTTSCAVCFVRCFAVKNLVSSGHHVDRDDVILISAGVDKTVNCFRTLNGSFRESVLADILPELSVGCAQLSSALLHFDSAVIAEENCRLSVGGFENGDLCICKTELDSNNLLQSCLLQHDVPISIAQFFTVHHNTDVLTLNVTDSLPDSSFELLLVSSPALGPVEVYSEIDLITGKSQGAFQLKNSSKYDCVLCAAFCKIRRENSCPVFDELLLVGTYGRMIVVYKREENMFCFVRTLSMPAPVIGLKPFSVNNRYVGVSTPIGFHVIHLT